MADNDTKEANGNTDVANSNTNGVHGNTNGANGDTVSCDRPQCSESALLSYAVGTPFGKLCGTSDPSAICELFD